MHQKINAAAAAASAGVTANGGSSEGEGKDKEGEDDEGTEPLRNPFADDEEDDDDLDSDDGNDDDQHGSSAAAAVTGAWGAASRGSWWRGVVRRHGGADKFDGQDDSDEEEEDEDDDEEFGDFAMPEVEAAPTAMATRSDKVLLKPLPVHPPASGTTGGPGQKSAFGSLWPFTSQGFGGGTKEEDGKERGEEEGENVEHGPGVMRAVEATSRTSIEDPDDEEVVV